MRRVRNKKTLCLAAAALILTCSAASGKALAYFTDYVSASGNAPVSMGFTDTEIEEKVSNWTKTVTVKNTRALKKSDSLKKNWAFFSVGIIIEV